MIWLIDYRVADNILMSSMAILVAMPTTFPWWGLLVLAAVFWFVQAFAGDDENRRRSVSPKSADTKR